MIKRSSSILVFMDLDGTITRKDTLIEFISFCFPRHIFYFGFITLSPVLFLNMLGFVSAKRAKEKVLSKFFKDMMEEKFKELGNEFTVRILPGLIRKQALNEIISHLESGARVVVVTASLPVWCEAWCVSNEMDIIATNYEVMNGRITGKIQGENCKGAEKVRRINEKYDIEKASRIYAYGDSKGDKEMLNIADVKYLKWKIKN